MPTYNNGPKAGDKVERERRESLSDFNKRKRDQKRRDGKKDYFSFKKLFSGSNNKSNRQNNYQTNNPIDMPSSRNNAPVGQEDWFASLGQSTNPNAFPVISRRKIDNSPSFPTRYRGYVPPVNNNSDNIFRRMASTGLGFALPAYGLAKTGSFLANKIFNTPATNRFDDVINFRKSRPRSVPYYENDIQNSLSTNMGQSLEPNPYIANRAGMFENIVGNNQTLNKPDYSFDRPANFQDTIMKDLALNMGQPFRVGTGAMAEVPYSNIANDPNIDRIQGRLARNTSFPNMYQSNSDSSAPSSGQLDFMNTTQDRPSYFPGVTPVNTLSNNPDKWTNYINNIRSENNRITNGVINNGFA